MVVSVLIHFGKHIQSVHEKIKYSCNLCGHQFTQQGNLKTHIQSVHEKIKYSCNLCEYQATTQDGKVE